MWNFPPPPCSTMTDTSLLTFVQTPQLHATEDLVLFDVPRDKLGRPAHCAVMSVCHRRPLSASNTRPEQLQDAVSYLILGGHDPDDQPPPTEVLLEVINV